jgi:SAM-dependent MidA family methyltransferase
MTYAMVRPPKMALLSPDKSTVELGHPELVQKLIARIDQNGPITFAEFMETALYDPDFGYYTTDSVIGAGGDYWTSSEVHPIYGDLLARQLAQAATVIAPTGVFTVLEMGAGRGTLAVHVLTALQREHPSLLGRLQYLIIERSAGMVRRQQEHLFPFIQNGISVRWLPNLAALAPDSIIGVILSNELVDAFPVHRVVQRRLGLREIFVGWCAASGGFIEVEASPLDPSVQHYFERLAIRLEDGQRAEVNLEGIDWMRRIARRLTKGIVLTVDYGHTASDLYSPLRKDGTLLCYYRETVSDNPYVRIGQQDITAHVDFTSLALIGEQEGLGVTGFTNQLHFLMGLGIEEAFAGLDPESKESGYLRRLLQPGGMGTTFKVLVQHKGMAAPALDALRSRPFLLDALYSGAAAHG